MEPASRAPRLRRFRLLPPNAALPATALNAELGAGDAAIGFEVAFAGGVHHACRQWGRRRLGVPAAGPALAVEIVAQRLLVETRLWLAGLIDIRRPEPRTVRGH